MFGLLDRKCVRLFRLLLALLALLTLVGCASQTSEAPNCEEILHPALRSVPFDELNATNVETWVNAHFPGATIGHNGPEALHWQSGRTIVSSYFQGGFRYFAQHQVDASPPPGSHARQVPTVGDVVRCFGVPELYSVQTIPAERLQVAFSMWYLKRGLIFRTVEPKSWPLPQSFTLASKLNDEILVVPPGSPQQMAASWWTNDPTYIASLMADLKQWPDNFQSAEVEGTSTPLPLLLAAAACVVGYMIVRELYLQERLKTLPAMLGVFAFLLGAPVLVIYSLMPSGVPVFILAIAVAGSALGTFGIYVTKVLIDRKRGTASR